MLSDIKIRRMDTDSEKHWVEYKNVILTIFQSSIFDF